VSATLSPRQRAAFFAGTLMILTGFHPDIRRRRKLVAAAAFAGAVAIMATLVAFIMLDYTPGKLTSGLMIAAMMGLFGCGMGLTSNDVIRDSQRRVKTRHEEPSPLLILFIPLAAMVVVVGISYWSVYDEWTAHGDFSRSRLAGLVLVTAVALFGVRAAFGKVDEWQEHDRQSRDVT
jgi:uncharacterized membrane protein